MRETSGISDNILSLPEGGGGMSPLGERFQPDLLRGSGSYSVPLNIPKGPNEVRPSLTLSYSTGAGNGPFGYGWRLNIMRIERRTDKGTPLYSNNDIFVVGDAEVLVDMGGGRYRLKTETKPWNIKKENEGWTIRTGDGHTMYFGRTQESREFEGDKIFSWCLDEELDAAGNSIKYTYQSEGNRLYIKKIEYSIFYLEFLYEDRVDVIRNGRSGFLRTTAKRTTQINLYCTKAADTLNKYWKLTYETAVNGASMLKSILLTGINGPNKVDFPKLDFKYTTFDVTNWDLINIKSHVAPPGLDDISTQLVDMTGDGLPDILKVSASGCFLWSNRGDGWLEGPVKVDGIPSTMALSNEQVAFADMDGNGMVELFSVNDKMQVLFSVNGKGGFDYNPTVFCQSPGIPLSSPNSRLFDVDGSGITGLIVTDRDNLLLYNYQPNQGWQMPLAVKRNNNLAEFPDVSFSNRGVRLADMTGDGLCDMVSLQSGNVCYWPYLGGGHWGSRIEMDLSPVLPPGYWDERLFLVDLDGDGCADLIYFDFDKTIIWFNRSGCLFSAPVEVPVVPISSIPRIIPVDFFGDGRPGIIWSAPTLAEYGSGYRFLRFDSGTKPYLLYEINNGMGGKFTMGYTTSVNMRLNDTISGLDCDTFLPFPVQVVQKIIEEDTITGRKRECSFTYHQGVFDGIEREFRGFSSVETLVVGDETCPSVKQTMEFFHGDPGVADLVERQRQRALSGAVLSAKIYEQKGKTSRLVQSSSQQWNTKLLFSGTQENVYFPYVSSMEIREFSSDGLKTRVETTQFESFDNFGNLLKKTRKSRWDDEPEENALVVTDKFSFVNNETDWLVNLPVRNEVWDGPDALHSVKICYYDGNDFIGLTEGQAKKGLLTRTRELKMLQAKLPSDYCGGRNFMAMGYIEDGAGPTQGFYADTYSAKRDAKGNVTVQKDSLGISLTVQFDADGVYPTQATDALGRVASYEFDCRSGQPVVINTPDGRRVRYLYDAAGRLKAEYEGDSSSETLMKVYHPDAVNIPNSITGIITNGKLTGIPVISGESDILSLAGVSISRIYYDGFGKNLIKLISVPSKEDGARRFIASGFNKMNSRDLICESYPPQFVDSLTFQLPVTDPLSIVKTSYDVFGAITGTRGPGTANFMVIRDVYKITHYEGGKAEPALTGIPIGPPSRIEYADARSRIVKIQEFKDDGTSIITSYNLTLDGKIVSIKNTAGNVVTEYTFAGPGEPLMIKHRDAGNQVYYRDAAGRLLERLNPDGSSLFFVYDVLGRLVKTDYAQSSAAPKTTVREIIYDSYPDGPSTGHFLTGRPALVRESGNEIRYSYNIRGLPVEETIKVEGQSLKTIRQYDPTGKLTSITYPDGRVIEYSLEENGAITGITGILSGVIYDESRAISGYNAANGMTIAINTDPVTRRISEISAITGSGMLRKLTFGYDCIGNITGFDDTAPGVATNRAMTYDSLHRLKGFEIPAGNPTNGMLATGSYSYDDEGNIKTIAEISKSTLVYGDVAHPGRVTSVSTAGAPANIVYNAKGQIISYGSMTSIIYDAFCRVVSITKNDGTVISLAYDQLDRRIMKKVNAGGATSQTFYAGVIFEKHIDHVERHIYLDKYLAATEKVLDSDPASASTLYYMSDHHGSIHLAVDQTGAVINSTCYTPFGVATGVSTKNRYIGKEYDLETGMLQFGARFFIPSIGRFLSPDWYVLEHPTKPMRIPQGYNVYGYALNNPMVFKDPSGLWFGIDDLIVAAAGFIVGFVGGLIYGLANGQGWSSFETAFETGLTTAIGAWLGWNTAGVFGLIVGGTNGFLAGVNKIYDLGSFEGWFALASDSSWNLLGTALGLTLHVVNLFYGSDRKYNQAESERKNRFVYDGGFGFSDFAFTQGNVISNARGRASLIDNHEYLHVTQQRIFGPLFQATYIVWAIGGFIVGSCYWLFNTDKDYGKVIETTSYYDNPFEYWAYNNDHNWPPSGGADVEKELAW
jgi:RHS repeat-associated protein